MKLSIEPSQLKGSLNIIASKSLSHRYLIAAALSNEPSILTNLMESDDITATKNALSTFGLVSEHNTFHGPLNIYNPVEIDAFASGSTLRFLIPIALLFDQEVIFKGKDRLPKRSLEVYEKLFKPKGLIYERLSEDHLPLKVRGPLQAGHYKVRGDISSQFITGLLFALSTHSEASSIEIMPPFESKPYVDLTVLTLRDFGIKIIENDLSYTIPENQKFKGVKKSIEGDYSQAAFFMVAGLIGTSPITIKGLSKTSLQGDKAILDIMHHMGGSYKFIDDELTVFPSKTTATTISLKNIPDLGPILMILAGLSQGTTIFKDISRLRIKESDRILAMEQTLKKLGVPYKTFKDSMHVSGVKQFKVKGPFDSFHDHRIVMSLMIASLRANQTIHIFNAEAINKSYPSFIDEMEKLGAKIKKEVTL